MITDQLLARFPLISDQVDVKELRALLTELELLLKSGARGAVVEFGCYIGTTSLFIKRLLDVYGSKAEFHVYDSFAGLPPKTSEDESPLGVQFVEGELFAAKKQFYENFKKAGLAAPIVHKAWFSDLTPADVPDDVFFAFLDGDYYESIKDSLRVIEPHLVASATIVVDDYGNEALPGASRATDEWLAAHPMTMRIQSSLAVLR
jgi:O-methyltransferase